MGLRHFLCGDTGTEIAVTLQGCKQTRTNNQTHDALQVNISSILLRTPGCLGWFTI